MSGSTFAKPRYGDRGPSLCRVCGTTMAAGMIAAGYATHPCCDPDERAWEWREPETGRTVIPMRFHREQPKRGFKRPSELIKEREANARQATEDDRSGVRRIG